MCLAISEFKYKIEKLKFWKRTYTAYKDLDIYQTGKIRTPYRDFEITSNVIEAEGEINIIPYGDSELRLFGGAIHCYRRGKRCVPEYLDRFRYATVRVIGKKEDLVCLNDNEIAFKKVIIHPEDYKILKAHVDRIKIDNEFARIHEEETKRAVDKVFEDLGV